MRRQARSPFSGDTRRRYGATVTFRREEDGELVTIAVEHLPVTESVRTAIERVEWMRGTWKVQCVSTPSTIWRDLQGIREQIGVSGFQGEMTSPVQPGHSPEANILSRIGRLDLYVPQNAEKQDAAGVVYQAPSFASELGRKTYE